MDKFYAVMLGANCFIGGGLFASSLINTVKSSEPSYVGFMLVVSCLMAAAYCGRNLLKHD